MTERRKQADSSLGAAINRMLDSNGLSQPMRQFAACALWPEAAGPEIAAVSIAQTVRGGVLFVCVKSAAWASELSFYKPELIDRINRAMGTASITDIHFKIGSAAAFKKPLPSEDIRPTEESLASIRPDGPMAAISKRSSGIKDEEADGKVRRVSARVAKMIAWKKEHGWRPCKSCGALFEPAVKGDICPVCSVLKRSP